MKNLLALLTVLLVATSCGTSNPELDMRLTPVFYSLAQEPAVEAEPNQLTERCIAPVFRIMVTDCMTDPEDPDVRRIYGGGSAVLVSIEKTDNPEHPYTYVFLTAGHNLFKKQMVRVTPFSEQTEIDVRLILHYWSYHPDGQQRSGMGVVDLCPENPNISSFWHKADGVDLGYLVVRTNMQLPYVRVAELAPIDSTDLSVGDPIKIVGCQKSSKPYIRTGIVSIDETWRYWGSAEAHKGDSGGGVFNKDNQLVGIIIWRPQGTGVGFIPISVFYGELLDREMFGLLDKIWKE